MFSRTTRVAAASARSATSPRIWAIARFFSASRSAVALARTRSTSSRAAARSRSRDSSASFWARVRISFASRRASWRVAWRSCSAASRSRRACSASCRPCSIRERRSFRVRVIPPKATRWTIRKKTTKFAAATMIQNRLIWNFACPASAAVWATWRRASPARAKASMWVTEPSGGSGCGRLDEDREQADDDREDAEALGERREDDREAADVAGGVGVATDRGSGEPAEDADADARADDAEGRKGAEVFHVPCSLRG